MPKDAKNKELAKEFLAYLCNEKYLLHFTKKMGTLRPFKYDASVLNAETLGLNDFNASVLEVYSFLQIILFGVLSILLILNILSPYAFRIIVSSIVLSVFFAEFFIVIINDIGSRKDEKKRFYLATGEREITEFSEDLFLSKHILEEKLTCMFRDKKLYLENLCLYSGEKEVFSCVSHELYHMAEIDDSFTDLILSAIKETIEEMPLYEKMKNTAFRLSNKPIGTIKKELQILFDLCWYVDSTKGMWIYSPPRHKCDLISFKKIAKIYFTEETYSVLTPITSYADLQPLPAARTVEDILNGIGKDTPQFLKTDYYKTVKSELNMLEYILGLKKV